MVDLAGRPLEVRSLGRIGYGEALRLQEDLVRARHEGRTPDVLLLLEHPPVVTRPARASADLVLATPGELRDRGIEVHETTRGGLVTFHGPGQLVAYPILDLRPDRCDLHRYLRDLEEVLLATAADFGIAASRVEGRTGIWVGDAKLAAIGVRVSRWVTMHGVALNVGEDLSGFEVIVPCGLRDAGVTSLSRLLGRPVELRDAAQRFVRHFCRVFERSPVREGGSGESKGKPRPAP